MSRYNRSYGYGRSSDRFGIGLILAVATVLVVVGLVGPIIYHSYSSHHEKTVTVTDKERVCKSGSDCNYLLFTTNSAGKSETFKVGDSILIRRFRSSDTYGSIHRCHRYKLTYYGWRNGWLSSYQNVIEAQDLGRAENCTVD